VIRARPGRNSNAKRAPRPKSSRGFNRQSVQEALRSLKAKLALYKDIPPNGLALFCGAFTDQDGKERKIMADVEPLRLLPHSVYKCDSRFHTEILHAQLANDERYGFMVVDGSCASFHLVIGDSRETIFKKEVQLPKKHGRGGQSQNRFARQRVEKRDWYTTDIASLATQHFIDPETNKVNVKGLIVSGSASLKQDVIKKLDPRVARAILKTYDVQYSGEAGFAQTLVLCEADLVDCRYTFERALLGKFFEAISADEGLYSFSSFETIYALEAGAVETLILCGDLCVTRYELFQASTGATKVTYNKPSQETTGDPSEWELKYSESLLDWILEHYKEFGSDLQVVSGTSTLGVQFSQGFGGIGAILRYKVESPVDVAEVSEEESSYEY